MAMIALFSLIFFNDLLEVKKDLQKNEQEIAKAAKIASFIDFLQLSRATSIQKNPNPQSLEKLQSYKKSLRADNLYAHLLKDGLRGGGDPLDDSYSYYTSNIQKLLNEFTSLPAHMNQKICQDYMQSFIYLLSAKESMGKIRYILLNSSIRHNLTQNDSGRLYELRDAFLAFMQKFKDSIEKKESLVTLQESINSKKLYDSLELLDFALEQKDQISLDEHKWFDSATKSIDTLNSIQNTLLIFMQHSIKAKIKQTQNHLFLAVVLLFLALLFGLYAVVVITKSIILQDKKLTLNLDASQLLLKQYKDVIDQSMIVSKTNPQGIITYANEQFCLISGYTQDELIGRSHNIVRAKHSKKATFEDLWHTIAVLKKPWMGELSNTKKDRTSYTVKIFIAPILDDDENVLEYIGVQTDITALVEQKRVLEMVAKTDHLTGFGNRYKLMQDLNSEQNSALALFNIDNFRELNDFYGHDFGDSVISEVSCVTHCFIADNKNLALYRLKGDEMAVVARNTSKEEFLEVCKKVLSGLKKRFIINEKEITLSWSCGVSFEPYSELFISADMALKLAKQKREDLVIYSDENSLKKLYEKNLKCVESITLALQDGRFRAFYQPIINNENQKIEKYECLVRMVELDGSIVTPYHFLDVAKKSKNYFEITKIVISEAFALFVHNIMA